jgi:hypothetical protein
MHAHTHIFLASSGDGLPDPRGAKLHDHERGHLHQVIQHAHTSYPPHMHLTCTSHPSHIHRTCTTHAPHLHSNLSWGFPETPVGCTEFDCKTTTGQCGMATGFCDTLPAKMQIDSVRVYQDLNDTRQSLGCNPPRYPTTRFIKAHASRYLRPMKVFYFRMCTATLHRIIDSRPYWSSVSHNSHSHRSSSRDPTM